MYVLEDAMACFVEINACTINSSFTGALKRVPVHYVLWGNSFAIHFNNITQF